MWVTTRIESDSISQAQVADSYDLATDCPFRVNASSRAPPVAEAGFLAVNGGVQYGSAGDAFLANASRVRGGKLWTHGATAPHPCL